MSAEPKVPIDPIQQRDDYRCTYCGRDGLESLNAWHDCCVDHFKPLSAGGEDVDDNKVTSCHYCNAIKGNQQFDTVDEARDYIRKRRGEWQMDYERVRKIVRGG